jgi:hypothetical protein
MTHTRIDLHSLPYNLALKRSTRWYDMIRGAELPES